MYRKYIKNNQRGSASMEIDDLDDIFSKLEDDFNVVNSQLDSNINQIILEDWIGEQHIGIVKRLTSSRLSVLIKIRSDVAVDELDNTFIVDLDHIKDCSYEYISDIVSVKLLEIPQSTVSSDTYTDIIDNSEIDIPDMAEKDNYSSISNIEDYRTDLVKSFLDINKKFNPTIREEASAKKKVDNIILEYNLLNSNIKFNEPMLIRAAQNNIFFDNYITPVVFDTKNIYIDAPNLNLAEDLNILNLGIDSLECNGITNSNTEVDTGGIIKIFDILNSYSSTYKNIRNYINVYDDVDKILSKAEKKQWSENYMIPYYSKLNQKNSYLTISNKGGVFDMDNQIKIKTIPAMQSYANDKLEVISTKIDDNNILEPIIGFLTDTNEQGVVSEEDRRSDIAEDSQVDGISDREDSDDMRDVGKDFSSSSSSSGDSSSDSSSDSDMSGGYYNFLDYDYNRYKGIYSMYGGVSKDDNNIWENIKQKFSYYKLRDGLNKSSHVLRYCDEHNVNDYIKNIKYKTAFSCNIKDVDIEKHTTINKTRFADGPIILLEDMVDQDVIQGKTCDGSSNKVDILYKNKEVSKDGTEKKELWIPPGKEFTNIIRKPPLKNKIINGEELHIMGYAWYSQKTPMYMFGDYLETYINFPNSESTKFLETTINSTININDIYINSLIPLNRKNTEWVIENGDNTKFDTNKNQIHLFDNPHTNVEELDDVQNIKYIKDRFPNGNEVEIKDTIKKDRRYLNLKDINKRLLKYGLTTSNIKNLDINRLITRNSIDYCDNSNTSDNNIKKKIIDLNDIYKYNVNLNDKILLKYNKIHLNPDDNIINNVESVYISLLSILFKESIEVITNFIKFLGYGNIENMSFDNLYNNKNNIIKKSFIQCNYLYNDDIRTNNLPKMDYVTKHILYIKLISIYYISKYSFKDYHTILESDIIPILSSKFSDSCFNRCSYITLPFVPKITNYNSNELINDVDKKNIMLQDAIYNSPDNGKLMSLLIRYHQLQKLHNKSSSYIYSLNSSIKDLQNEYEQFLMISKKEIVKYQLNQELCDKCKIVKTYKSVEELLNDNGKQIYIDKANNVKFGYLSMLISMIEKKHIKNARFFKLETEMQKNTLVTELTKKIKSSDIFSKFKDILDPVDLSVDRIDIQDITNIVELYYNYPDINENNIVKIANKNIDNLGEKDRDKVVMIKGVMFTPVVNGDYGIISNEKNIIYKREIDGDNRFWIPKKIIDTNLETLCGISDIFQETDDMNSLLDNFDLEKLLNSKCAVLDKRCIDKNINTILYNIDKYRRHISVLNDDLEFYNDISQEETISTTFIDLNNQIDKAIITSNQNIEFKNIIKKNRLRIYSNNLVKDDDISIGTDILNFIQEKYVNSFNSILGITDSNDRYSKLSKFIEKYGLVFSNDHDVYWNSSTFIDKEYRSEVWINNNEMYDNINYQLEDLKSKLEVAKDSSSINDLNSEIKVLEKKIMKYNLIKKQKFKMCCLHYLSFAELEKVDAPERESLYNKIIKKWKSNEDEDNIICKNCNCVLDKINFTSDTSFDEDGHLIRNLPSSMSLSDKRLLDINLVLSPNELKLYKSTLQYYIKDLFQIIPNIDNLTIKDVIQHSIKDIGNIKYPTFDVYIDKLLEKCNISNDMKGFPLIYSNKIHEKLSKIIKSITNSSINKSIIIHLTQTEDMTDRKTGKVVFKVSKLQEKYNNILEFKHQYQALKRGDDTTIDISILDNEILSEKPDNIPKEAKNYLETLKTTNVDKYEIKNRSTFLFNYITLLYSYKYYINEQQQISVLSNLFTTIFISIPEYLVSIQGIKDIKMSISTVSFNNELLDNRGKLHNMSVKPISNENYNLILGEGQKEILKAITKLNIKEDKYKYKYKLENNLFSDDYYEENKSNFSEENKSNFYDTLVYNIISKLVDPDNLTKMFDKCTYDINKLNILSEIKNNDNWISFYPKLGYNPQYTDENVDISQLIQKDISSSTSINNLSNSLITYMNTLANNTENFIRINKKGNNVHSCCPYKITKTFDKSDSIINNMMTRIESLTKRKKIDFQHLETQQLRELDKIAFSNKYRINTNKRVKYLIKSIKNIYLTFSFDINSFGSKRVLSKIMIPNYDTDLENYMLKLYVNSSIKSELKDIIDKLKDEYPSIYTSNINIEVPVKQVDNQNILQSKEYKLIDSTIHDNLGYLYIDITTNRFKVDITNELDEFIEKNRLNENQLEILQEYLKMKINSYNSLNLKDNVYSVIKSIPQSNNVYIKYQLKIISDFFNTIKANFMLYNKNIFNGIFDVLYSDNGIVNKYNKLLEDYEDTDKYVEYTMNVLDQLWKVETDKINRRIIVMSDVIRKNVSQMFNERKLATRLNFIGDKGQLNILSSTSKLIEIKRRREILYKSQLIPIRENLDVSPVEQPGQQSSSDGSDSDGFSDEDEVVEDTGKVIDKENEVVIQSDTEYKSYLLAYIRKLTKVLDKTNNIDWLTHINIKRGVKQINTNYCNLNNILPINNSLVDNNNKIVKNSVIALDQGLIIEKFLFTLGLYMICTETNISNLRSTESPMRSVEVRKNIETIGKNNTRNLYDSNLNLLLELENVYNIENVSNNMIEDNEIKINLGKQEKNKKKIYEQDDETKNTYFIYRQFGLGKQSGVNYENPNIDSTPSWMESDSELSSKNPEDVYKPTQAEDLFSNTYNESYMDTTGDSNIGDENYSINGRQESDEGAESLSGIHGEDG